MDVVIPLLFNAAGLIVPEPSLMLATPEYAEACCCGEVYMDISVSRSTVMREIWIGGASQQLGDLVSQGRAASRATDEGACVCEMKVSVALCYGMK